MLHCSTPLGCRGRIMGWQGQNRPSGPVGTWAATDSHDPAAVHRRTRMALQLGKRVREQIFRTKEAVVAQHRTTALVESGVRLSARQCPNVEKWPVRYGRLPPALDGKRPCAGGRAVYDRKRCHALSVGRICGKGPVKTSGDAKNQMTSTVYMARPTRPCSRVLSPSRTHSFDCGFPDPG